MRLKQSEKNKGHEVVDEYIYGPVHSRRYGTSLGINLLPESKKICNFNCVYCQLGWADTPRKFLAEAFPLKDDIIKEMEDRFPQILSQTSPAVDHIVISGNGEPTLHPDFYEISSHVLGIIKKQNKKIPVTCLTNGTMLGHKKIVMALNQLSEACVKLDAALEKIDIPQKDFDINTMIAQMGELKNLVIQACFMEGSISNVDKKSVDEWLSWMKHINPMRVDLYTVSRNTPLKDLRPVSFDRLTEISKMLLNQGCKKAEIYTE